MKLAELAQQLGAEYRGTPDAEITGVAGIEEAGPEEEPDNLSIVVRGRNWWPPNNCGLRNARRKSTKRIP